MPALYQEPAEKPERNPALPERVDEFLGCPEPPLSVTDASEHDCRARMTVEGAQDNGPSIFTHGAPSE
jgi:hypothetical protein